MKPCGTRPRIFLEIPCLLPLDGLSTSTATTRFVSLIMGAIEIIPVAIARDNVGIMTINPWSDSKSFVR